MKSIFNLFKKQKEVSADTQRVIPGHIAFIMDGNGRWAKARSMPREFGHSEGAKAFRNVVRYCSKIGVKHVTVYAFSTENWKRPEKEVSSIMKLLSDFMDEAFADMDKNKFRVIFLGSKEPFSEELRCKMIDLEKTSAKYTQILNVAFNYGGRDEIVHAVNELIGEGCQKVTEELISEHLYTRLSPDPDLIVRTAGEYRISNFLLWQAAYAEFYYTDKLWPEFDEAEIDKAIDSFNRRERRYGGVNAVKSAK